MEEPASRFLGPHHSTGHSPTSFLPVLHRPRGNFSTVFYQSSAKGMDAIRLTPKEIARSDEGHTVVVRPQANGGYMVAVVEVEGQSGLPMGRAFTRYVEDKGEIPAAVKDVVRTLSKMGFPGNMGDATRERWKPQHHSYDRRTAKVKFESVLHQAAEADQKVGEAYLALHSFKAGLDAMEEIPNYLQPIYNQTMKALGPVTESGQETYQLKMMLNKVLRSMGR